MVGCDACPRTGDRQILDPEFAIKVSLQLQLQSRVLNDCQIICGVFFVPSEDGKLVDKHDLRSRRKGGGHFAAAFLML